MTGYVAAVAVATGIAPNDLYDTDWLTLLTMAEYLREARK